MESTARFVRFLVRSSADPTRYALTVKGAIGTLIPLILVYAQVRGITDPVLGSDLESFGNAAFAAVTTVGVAIGSIVTLLGIARKLWITLKFW